jgi:hypothetical protein
MHPVQGPPQSVSLSPWLRVPSEQVGVVQCLVPSHRRLVQSEPCWHFRPGSQSKQEPPQSTSVSLPSCTPSLQLSRQWLLTQGTPGHCELLEQYVPVEEEDEVVEVVLLVDVVPLVEVVPVIDVVLVLDEVVV